jgi:pseudouridine-5'-phosphate glycosidase
MLHRISGRIRRRAFSPNRRLLSSVNPLLNFLRIESSVQQALDENRPVVALESTIVAHGMPFPQNVELAEEVESILRSKVRAALLFLVLLLL